ncbi:MAG: UDP-glucose 4-epimerase GalE [Candidatus Gracilibacteria bacterium]|nr:UDP-glucose 4-epimerase GalE [Candidatus Gracilibacteria bacterium]MDQ7023134.1 UDP-glucose 4-epimerase GalE [Candidatus Gracilibacteria bacterium]
MAFEQAGYKTVIVDNLSNSNLYSLKGIEKIIGYKPDFYNIDLRNKEKLEEIFQKYNFDGVIHFAGLKAVGESCKKPDLYFDNNVNGSNNLFGLMKKYNVKNIVFSSSATVYTPENKSPLDENMETGKCSNPYGTTKFLIENILKDLATFSGFKVMNLRYFNPIGAHSSGFIGENPEGIPNNLLPFIMKVATSELKELTVFGNDYNTIDGTGVRDYIDVLDLINGHLKAYKNISPGFKTYNLGVGKGISVLEMIKSSEKITGTKINYSIIGRRSGDLAEVYCNPKKAFKELGWKAEISLKESLENSWRFYNN